MNATLYRQAKDIERRNGELRDSNSPSEIDVAELQRNLFRIYEGNPVLYDAMQGKQSIEESLQGLGKVNRGIRKILPWRRNEGHNERLKQLGELVSEPDHLHTYGTFIPDNLITIGAEVAAVVFGASYLASHITRYLLSLNPDVSPEELQQAIHTFQVGLPTEISKFVVMVFGIIATARRFGELPTDEAKYLDGKVQEFYKF